MELLVYDGTERRMRRYQLEEGEPLPFAGGVTAGEFLSDGYGAPLWSSRAFLEALAALAETAGPLALRRGLDRRELGPFLFGAGGAGLGRGKAGPSGGALRPVAAGAPNRAGGAAIAGGELVPAGALAAACAAKRRVRPGGGGPAMDAWPGGIFHSGGWTL